MIQKFFNGEPVKKVPKNAKLVRVRHEKYYEDEEYSKKSHQLAAAYFQKMREDREELEKRHG